MQLNHSSKMMNSSKMILKVLCKITFDFTDNIGFRICLISSLYALFLGSNASKTFFFYSIAPSIEKSSMKTNSSSIMIETGLCLSSSSITSVSRRRIGLLLTTLSDMRPVGPSKKLGVEKCLLLVWASCDYFISSPLIEAP